MTARRLAMSSLLLAGLAGASYAQEAENVDSRIGYVNLFEVKDNTVIYQRARDELSNLDRSGNATLQRAQRFLMLTGKDADRAVELDGKAPDLTPDERKEYERLRELDLKLNQERADIMRLTTLTPDQEKRFQELLQISRTRAQELKDLEQTLEAKLADAEKRWNDAAANAFISALKQVQQELKLEVVLQSHIRVYRPSEDGQSLVVDLENVILIGGRNITQRVIEVMNQQFPGEARPPAGSTGGPAPRGGAPPPPGGQG